MKSLFSLDVTGEDFSEPPVSEELDDELVDDEESSINVKEPSDSKVDVAEKDPKLIKISLASHVRDLTNINPNENPEQYEVYRNLTMEIRKFIYNSIVSEDFCVNCKVINDSNSDLAKNTTHKPSTDANNNNSSNNNNGKGVKNGKNNNNNNNNTNNNKTKEEKKDNNNNNENTDSNKEKENNTNETNEDNNSEINTDTMSDYQPCKNIVSQQTSMSVDGFNEVMSFDMNDGIEKLTSTSSDDISSISSLESLSLDNSESTDDVNNNESSSSYKDTECILLELSPSKLNRTVMEMAHVLMRRFFSSYPRNFKAATGNIASDVYALGKRYYISNDQGTDDINLDDLDKSHVLYLAHLYRRQRNICYFCGFDRCDRSKSSKNPCQFLKCTRCLGYHRWSSRSCKSGSKVVDKFLQSNDWRNKRPNYWASQPPPVKELLHCFYCNNFGEANFKCQGLSCPEGADTLWVRCLELLGTKRLKQERHSKPHLFPHCNNRKFVFDEKFKPTHKK